MHGVSRGVPAILVGGFFVFVAFMMTQDRVGEIRRGADSADWPSVQGEVLRSSVMRGGGGTRGGRRWRLVFAYRYEVAGTTYEGRRVAFTAIKIRRVPDTFPQGATVLVRYDPDDPAVSVLEPGVETGAVVGSLAPFLVFAAVGLALAGWGLHLMRAT